MKVEKPMQGRISVQSIVRLVRGLSTVRHVTLQEGPLWNANGNIDGNFHSLPVCWCGNVWA
jgi:hypothetical protein